MQSLFQGLPRKDISFLSVVSIVQIGMTGQKFWFIKLKYFK
jgi:hypothetical protein